MKLDDEKLERQIKVDLGRTFPTNLFFLEKVLTSSLSLKLNLFLAFRNLEDMRSSNGYSELTPFMIRQLDMCKE